MAQISPVYETSQPEEEPPCPFPSSESERERSRPYRSDREGEERSNRNRIGDGSDPELDDDRRMGVEIGVEGKGVAAR